MVSGVVLSARGWSGRRFCYCDMCCYRTLRVWVKRDNGQYWPSIVQSFDCESRNSPLQSYADSSLTVAATSALIRYSQDDGNHKVFVGLGSGQIMVGKVTRQCMMDVTVYIPTCVVCVCMKEGKFLWLVSTIVIDYYRQQLYNILCRLVVFLSLCVCRCMWYVFISSVLSLLRKQFINILSWLLFVLQMLF